MHSTLTPRPNDDPHDVVVVAPDAVRVAPSDAEISHLLQQAARFHSDAQARAASDSPAAPAVPPVDTTFRPSAVNDVLGPGNRPSIGRRLGRAFAALLLAVCIGAAAIAWQAFGYAGKKMIVKWTPQFVLTSLSLEKWGLAAPSTPPDVPADAADATSPQPAPLAQTAAAAVAPSAAAPSPDPARSLQSMARDLASVGQEVEQLKASIEQLKANQQQISRDIAKTSETKASEIKPSEIKPSEIKPSEQNKASDQTRPRISALPPRPSAARPHKPTAPYPAVQAYPPTQAYPPAQAAVAPPSPQPAASYYVPRQSEPQPPAAAQQLSEPGSESTPRPPMPVR
jgi:hypothetical protein